MYIIRVGNASMDIIQTRVRSTHLVGVPDDPFHWNYSDLFGLQGWVRADPKSGAIFAHVLQQFRCRRRVRQSVVRRFGTIERRFFHVDLFRL